MHHPGLQLPAVLATGPGGVNVLLDHKALAKMEGLQELVEALKEKISPEAD